METIVTIAVVGAIGGLLKSLVEQKGAVVLPSIEIAQDGTKYIHLGFISNLIVGTVVALLTTTTPITALFAGVSSAFLAEKVLELAKTTSLPVIGK